MMNGFALRKFIIFIYFTPHFTSLIFEGSLIPFPLVAVIYCLDFHLCHLSSNLFCAPLQNLCNSVLSLNCFLCTILISLKFSGWKKDVFIVPLA